MFLCSAYVNADLEELLGLLNMFLPWLMDTRSQCCICEPGVSVDVLKNGDERHSVALHQVGITTVALHCALGLQRQKYD